MIEKTDAMQLIDNAFNQYCSMHELARVQADFPKNIIKKMEEHLAKTIPFSVANCRYVFSNQERDYAPYQIPFIEKILHAKEHLKELSLYYTEDSNASYHQNHLGWFLKQTLNLPIDKRKEFYHQDLLQPARESVVNDYLKRYSKLSKNDIVSFCGRTVIRTRAEKINLKTDFMTYFLTFARERLLTSHSEPEQNSRLATLVIQNYLDTNNMSFDEFKEKYAFSALTFTKGSTRFNSLVEFFKINFKEEKQYISALLSHLNDPVRPQKVGPKGFIKNFLTFGMSYEDKSLEGVQAQTTLFKKLYSLTHDALLVETNKFNAQTIQENINTLFENLNEFKLMGLDLNYLLNLEIKDKEKTLPILTELFEQTVAQVLEKNSRYSTPEIEKILFEAKSELRNLATPTILNEGKKIKL